MQNHHLAFYHCSDFFFLQTFGFERNHVCWKKITDPESQELDSQRRHWWFMEGPGICHRKKTGFFCPPKIKAETWWGAINVVGAICFFFFGVEHFFTWKISRKTLPCTLGGVHHCEDRAKSTKKMTVSMVFRYRRNCMLFVRAGRFQYFDHHPLGVPQKIQ